jgi:hypothetical protein
MSNAPPRNARNMSAGSEVLSAVAARIGIAEVWLLPTPTPQAPSPLPDIAGHIQAAGSRGAIREAAHGARAADARLAIVRAVWLWRIITSGIEASVRAPRGPLPLGFVWQGEAVTATAKEAGEGLGGLVPISERLAQPIAVAERVVERQRGHGVIRQPSAVAVRVALLITAGLDERGELRHGHRVAPMT